MYFTLTDGRKARIMIAHTKTATKRGERRATRLKFCLSGRTFQVTAICSPEDNFCKALGRKYAAAKLLERIRNPKTASDTFLTQNLTKKDRTLIFKAVCPNFFS